MPENPTAETLEVFNKFLQVSGTHLVSTNVPEDYLINCLYKVDNKIIIGLQDAKLGVPVANIRVCGWRVEFEVDGRRLLANPFSFDDIRKLSKESLLAFLKVLIVQQPDFSCYKTCIDKYKVAGPVTPFGRAHGWVVLLERTRDDQVQRIPG